MIKFGIVIVTYNRIDKLKKTLNCYKEQTYLPYSIVVINNQSRATAPGYGQHPLPVSESSPD